MNSVREESPARAEPVFGVTDAARALNCSTTWVMKLCRRGYGAPTVPVGTSGRRMFSRGDLEELARRAGRPLHEKVAMPDRAA